MQQIAAHGVDELVMGETGWIVVALAQVEEVTFVSPGEERYIPNQCAFGAKVQRCCMV
jgi:hypothetical protein